MAKPMSKKELRDRLLGQDIMELIGIIVDLHDLNAENKLFLQTRLQKSMEPKTALAPFKKIISDNLCPDDFNAVSIKTAKKAISDYRKATQDEDGALELMVYFLETGTACIVEYGDMWESYYDSLSSLGSAIVKKVKKLDFNSPLMQNLEPRLRKIRDDSSNVGWGFGDDMGDMYYEVFGE